MKQLIPPYDFGEWFEWNESWLMALDPDSLTDAFIDETFKKDLARDTARHIANHQPAPRSAPWNILEERLVSPLFVIHDSRLVHQNSCSSVRCSCSRSSSASPSTGLCSVCTELKMCVQFDSRFVHTSFVYISMTYINVCNVCTVCRLFQVRSAVFQNMSFFL